MARGLVVEPRHTFLRQVASNWRVRTHLAKCFWHSSRALPNFTRTTISQFFRHVYIGRSWPQRFFLFKKFPPFLYTRYIHIRTFMKDVHWPKWPVWYKTKRYWKSYFYYLPFIFTQVIIIKIYFACLCIVFSTCCVLYTESLLNLISFSFSKEYLILKK